ncbi:ribosome small subunit-dependent GTPase A [Anthocerotibacter panamensis]|uniref:ribosome small subunit-dependent GTPase A n=1 Tax=Anthocerotibacter panamensis TaxID=2857077 RepID=UPI001C404BB0|nr:ribosome small subunit-dependent GTPase A [Anthocerotibacter panamensis]
MTRGIVTAIQANYYQVQVPDEPEGRLCKIRSRLKKVGAQVWVGDEVVLSESTEEGDQGAIQEVLPRKSLLVRPAIANIDLVVLVLSTQTPHFERETASRFLVQIEASGLVPLVVLNKIDLLVPEALLALVETLKRWGYPPVAVSTVTGYGLDTLTLHLGQRTAVLAGPSGAGKSSLLNALQPGLSLRVGAVSERQGQGRHTTRHVELFTLPGEVRLADTPGFSQIELTATAAQLAFCFPEFRPWLGHCQFRNCLHRDEPDCALREADLERFPFYQVLLSEVLDAQPLSGAALKAQSRPRNTRPQVLKLSTAHRQASRRTDRQTLWEQIKDEDTL